MPHNVSRHLRAAALRHPQRIATQLYHGEAISFAQLDAECDRFAKHFEQKGIRPGMRVVLAIKPGLTFVPAIFGCFRLGAIPICIDPGMRLKHLLACVKEAKPQAMVGIRPALWLATVFRSAFSSVKIRLAVPKIVPGRFSQTQFCAHPTNEEQIAAILFTSGSTGIPKGVVYTHGAFDTQQRLLKETYEIKDNEVDLVVFPLFALFSAAWGITAVIPHMDPARPAKTSGKLLADAIRRFSVTHTSGSPAIWRNLSDFCHANQIKLPTLRRILMAGAQVPEKLIRRCLDIAEQIHTPYGATEALPLTTISDKELLACFPKTRAGAGTCVGRPIGGVEIVIIPFIAGPIPYWNDSLRQPPFKKGEVVVRAPWVTKEYFQKNETTQKAKIPSEGGVWHRMGDSGYLDEAGKLWFCGRKDHRILFAEQTLFPDPIEAIFDGLPQITRSAVVGVGPPGKQWPVLVLEGKKGSVPLRLLQEHVKKHPLAAPLSRITFYKRFPLDVRHNIKIDRPKLAKLIESSLL